MIYSLLWIELCLPKFMLKSDSPVLQNVTLEMVPLQWQSSYNEVLGGL